MSAPPAPASRRARWGSAAVVAGLAVLAYVPLLLTHRGKVAADSKQYLYLDPGRLLDRAPYLWQPEVHLGTVTHQNIGYLFPAGPWFWTFDRLGLPDWVAQRLWLGTILFVAGAGMLYLLRTLGVRDPGRSVAAFVYMLSPYTLVFASRLSVLLLAWSVLPWLLALTARALRTGDWRAPAAFALLVQVGGSINLTALVLVGIAPVLWILYTTAVTREHTVRRALTTTARIGVLTVGASLWWLAALSVQAGYGLNILDYSETVNVVSLGGHAGEVLRGLGNWFFYGGDLLGNWIEASVDYTTERTLIVVSYALVAVVFAAAAVLRWRSRAYFVALVVIGVLIGVGVHPYDDPSPFGRVLKTLSEGSSVGMALRNVGRAVPLVVLGGAVLVGAGVTAAYEWLRPRGRRTVGAVLAAAVVGLAVLNLPALWDQSFYGKNLLRPEDVPEYWSDAIAALDAEGTDSRVLELPGADFAAYTWGNAVEPITPGLTDRPYVARELIPYGSPASANLLQALDRRVQMGLLEPEAVAPLARLLATGDVVLRSDLQTDRFDLVRAREVVEQFSPAPPGTSGPTSYGDGLGSLVYSLLDERTLASPNDDVDPAPVEVYHVDDPRPLLSAAAGPGLVVSGDGDGIVDVASVGLLAADPLIRYSAPATDAGAGPRVPKGAALVVTDTNRRRAQRWTSIQYNVGYTEEAGEPTERDRDPFDHRLEVFPDAGDAARTVTEQRDATVTASAYGSRALTYLPADRPARALDGDVRTAWRVGRFTPVVGEWLRIQPSAPVEADSVNLVQPLVGERNRSITRVRLEFRDGAGARVGDDVVADLGPESQTATGQTITFPARTFDRLDIVVEADSLGPRRAYLQESPVGFAEVRIGRAGVDEGVGVDEEVGVDEVVRMPVDLVDTAAARDRGHPLVYLATRQRNWMSIPDIAEAEAAIARALRVPTERSFGLTGDARVANTAPDDLVDAVLGYPTPAQGGIAARSSDRVRTTLAARASSAFDGDPATAWQSSFDTPAGQWVEVDTPAPVTFDRLDLRIVADGRHSVPTRLRIDAGGQSRTVDLPALRTAKAPHAVPVSFAPLSGDRVRVTIEDVEPVLARKGAEEGRPAPVAIAEVGIPGVERGVAPAVVPSVCRTDLVTIDGTPVPVQVAGTRSDAEAGTPLTVSTCPRELGTALDAGDHVLRATPGARTGIDLDRLVLGSGAAGDAVVLDDAGAAALSRSVVRAAPRLRVTEAERTHWRAEVTGADGPFVVVLHESFNEGWKLEVDGRGAGEPELVDGYANGWVVDPGDARRLSIALDWTPQRRIWIALGLSVATGLACVVLLFVPRRRGSVEQAGGAADAPALESPFTVGPAAAPRGAPVGVGTTVAVALAVAAFGTLFAAPWVGLVAGVVTAGALRWPAWRWVPSVVALGSVAVTGLYVAVQQSRYRYPPVIDWPTFFDRVHRVALLAVILLGVDAIVRLIADRRRGGAEPEDPGAG